MSQTASPRAKKVLLGLFILAVAAVVVFAVVRFSGDDTTEPLATRTTSTTDVTTAPTTEATTKKPKPTPTGSCDGPDTQFNVEGEKKESLLPDCGTTPVTRQEQKKEGLGLACGGSYPVILYKTTTSGAKTSICGKDASGESFRLVTNAGGALVDLPGDYEPQLDAFVAGKDGTRYTVIAYDGTLQIKKNGSTTSQKSSEWISLDNESDYD